MKIVLFLILLGLSHITGLNNGLGMKPQMGFNTWNAFHCDINQNVVLESMAQFVQLGFLDAGYEYFNLDDCWAGWRDTNGDIHADNTTFPDGIAFLAKKAHSMGLKFGIYSDAGTRTCAGRPGSLGFETNDANSYASWKVDYLKYDNCHNNGISPKIRYPIMRDALNKTKRGIFYSLCDWGFDSPATWGKSVGNSWRTTLDIQDFWLSIVYNIWSSNKWAEYAGPGGWNDPDLLEIGNGLSTEEEMAQFSLWSIAKAPLIVSTPLHAISNTSLKILLNKEVISVNQDSLGVQGKIVHSELWPVWRQIWAGPLSNNRTVVVLWNLHFKTTQVTLLWDYVNIPSDTTCVLRDIWQHKNVGNFSKSFTATIPSHGVKMLVLKDCY